MGRPADRHFLTCYLGLFVCVVEGRHHARLDLKVLRHDSPDASDLAVSLAALKDWTFLFGPGLVVPFGNGLILGYLNVPLGPRLAPPGLARNDRRAASPDRGLRVLFDWWDQTGAVSILVVPEFLWELVLGFYPLIWGFRRVPIVDEYDRDHGIPVRATPEPVPA